MKIKQQYLIRLMLVAFLAQQGICLGEQATSDPKLIKQSTDDTKGRLKNDSSVAATDPTSASATTTTDSNSGGSGTAREPYLPLPTTMQNRCGEARIKRMLEAGGNPQTEIAIQKGIDWLKSKQNPDGSWGLPSSLYPNAETSFALLVLTGHCEIAEDSESEAIFTKAVVFLLDQFKKNHHFGSRGSWGDKGGPGVYEYALATYALAEAYIFCQSFSIEIPELKETLKTAGNRVLSSQSHNGGWAYMYREDKAGDTSISAFHMQAVYACQLTGLWPNERFQPIYDRFMKGIVARQSKAGGVGYVQNLDDNTKDRPKLTCNAYFCFQLGGRGKSEPAKKMLEFIKSEGYNTGKCAKMAQTPYYQYYLFQAMRNDGGDEWNKYHHILRDSLLESQFKTGQWLGNNEGAIPGTHMGTCLALLTLQTYYRNLPPKQVGEQPKLPPIK